MIYVGIDVSKLTFVVAYSSAKSSKTKTCRKRSIPTHSERLNPPTIIAKLALKSA